jgi:hypothetical protein
MLRSLELGTGILLLVTDTHLRGVKSTIGTWALSSGTCLSWRRLRPRAGALNPRGSAAVNVRIGVPAGEDAPSHTHPGDVLEWGMRVPRSPEITVKTAGSTQGR